MSIQAPTPRNGMDQVELAEARYSWSLRQKALEAYLLRIDPYSQEYETVKADIFTARRAIATLERTAADLSIETLLRGNRNPPAQ